MKILPILLVLGLSACASLGVQESSQTSLTNRYGALLADYTTAVRGADAFAKNCVEKKIPTTCRPIVKKAQGLDVKAHASLDSLYVYAKDGNVSGYEAFEIGAKGALTAFSTYVTRSMK